MPLNPLAALPNTQSEGTVESLIFQSKIAWVFSIEKAIWKTKTITKISSLRLSECRSAFKYHIVKFP